MTKLIVVINNASGSDDVIGDDYNSMAMKALMKNGHKSLMKIRLKTQVS